MRCYKNMDLPNLETITALCRRYGVLPQKQRSQNFLVDREILEKMARALEVPLYQLLYDGEEPPALPNPLKRKSTDDLAWGSSGKDAQFLGKLRRALGKANEQDRKLLLQMVQKMAIR
jgi:hypothetical protein